MFFYPLDKSFPEDGWIRWSQPLLALINILREFHFPGLDLSNRFSGLTVPHFSWSGIQRETVNELLQIIEVWNNSFAESWIEDDVICQLMLQLQNRPPRQLLSLQLVYALVVVFICCPSYSFCSHCKKYFIFAFLIFVVCICNSIHSYQRIRWDIV